jgi:hypothetical protein
LRTDDGLKCGFLKLWVAPNQEPESHLSQAGQKPSFIMLELEDIRELASYTPNPKYASEYPGLTETSLQNFKHAELPPFVAIIALLAGKLNWHLLKHFF